MDVHSLTGPEDRPPMVLRAVPPARRHLARAMSAPAAERAGGRWWEWVDAAADIHLPADAVALTYVEPSGCVVVSVLVAEAGDAEDAGAELLRALLAALRSRSVDVVAMRTTERPVVRALLSAGFGPDPDLDDRYVIVL
jgi:hypothetical protein